MPVSDPKQIAAMLVGEMHPGGHGGATSSEQSDGDKQYDGDSQDQMDPGEEAAGEEMMQALQANDVHGFVSALKSFLQLV